MSCYALAQSRYRQVYLLIYNVEYTVHCFENGHQPSRLAGYQNLRNVVHWSCGSIRLVR